MSELDEYLMPFAVLYELAGLALDRLRLRFNRSCERCPS